MKRFFAKNLENETPVDLKLYKPELIRNFSIVAHVDHGKSTLADRILEFTGAIEKNQENKQVMDSLPVERARGITVKAQSASLFHTSRQGHQFMLNLIDTPGHVDFNFEVKRSLASCDSVVLLVDANQGVQAQTLANFYLAFEKDLCIIPVLNKIDLPKARPELVKEELRKLFDIEPENVLEISAKYGKNIDVLINRIIEESPSPKVPENSLELPLSCLILDSWYRNHFGCVVMVIVNQGVLSIDQPIISSYTNTQYRVKKLGIFTPTPRPVEKLYPGQIGFVIAGMKQNSEAIVGDVLMFASFASSQTANKLTAQATPQRPPPISTQRSVVFASFYPDSQDHFPDLQRALDKLLLNDASVSVQPERSDALGAGWRLGFLGLLHMDVFRQRLQQEFRMDDVIVTTPSLPYRVKLRNQKQHSAKKKAASSKIDSNSTSDWSEITSVSQLPPMNQIEAIEEKIILSNIICPEQSITAILKLVTERRGTLRDQTNLNQERILLRCTMPLAEIATGFYDKLKAVTSGYASFDYEEHGWREANLEKIDVLLNGKLVEEFSQLVHVSHVREYSEKLAHDLAIEIPRQQFLIKVQVACGSKIISRSDVKPYRKDVTQKLKHGGDESRRQKLLKNQANAKKRMRMIGEISVPKSVFINIFKNKA